MRLTCLSLFSLILSVPVLYAQTETATQPEAGKKPTGKISEKITVTGSYIKRLNLEGPAPVTSIDAGQIKESGMQSIGDILREQSSVSFGSRRENAGGASAGDAHVDLRGLGDQRTLVLLNGRRLAKRSASGSVDLNMIPVAAIEKIEILKDGASATYGTDAIGGVVNIITKKNYEGSALSVTTSRPEKAGGEETAYSYIHGTVGEKTSSTTIIQYKETKAITNLQKDGEFKTNTVRQKGGTYGSVAQKDAKDKYTFKAHPDCPSDILDSKGECTYNFADTDFDRIPASKSLNLYSELKHRINDDLEVFAEGFASRKEIDWRWMPYNDQNKYFTAKQPSKVLAGVDASQFPSITPDDTRELHFKVSPTEVGDDIRHVEANDFGLAGGLKGSWSDWDWEASISETRGYQNDTNVNGSVIIERVNRLIDEGQYNPLKPVGERGSLDLAKASPWRSSVTNSHQINARATGPLIEVADITVSTAIGVELYSESYTDSADPRLTEEVSDFNAYQSYYYTSMAGSYGGGSRDVKSAFSEFSIPVLKNLELQLAARHDQYSDFGATTNPKAAFRYAPWEGGYLRGSYTTGFKAPALDDLYRGTYLQHSTYNDEVLCREKNICTQQTINYVSGGNTALKQERSKSLNIGVGFEPLKNLTATADYWTVTIDDVIANPNISSLLKAEAEGTDISQWATVERDPSTRAVTKLTALKQNLGKKTVRGADFSLGYRLNTSGGILGMNSQQGVVYQSISRDFPGDPENNRVGNRLSPKWKNQTSVSWGLNDYYTALAARSIAAQKNNPINRVGFHVEFDYYFRYTAAWKGEFNLGVENLLNRKVPYVDSGASALYSFRGRTYNLGYTQNL